MLGTVRANSAYCVNRFGPLAEGKAPWFWVTGKNPPIILASIEILMHSTSLGVRRDTIRIGKRVHSRSATGNGISVKLCSKEDFPADWSPTMTSWFVRSATDLIVLVLQPLGLYFWEINIMICTAAPQLINAFEEALTMLILKSILVKQRMFQSIIEVLLGHDSGCYRGDDGRGIFVAGGLSSLFIRDT